MKSTPPHGRGSPSFFPAGEPGGFATRLVQLLALGIVFAMVVGAALTRGESAGLPTVAAVGFLLLAGTLASELLGTLGLPHLSGYLLAGIIAGPHLMGLVDHGTVERLSPINTLALALIALSGGAELRVATLRKVGRSVAYALLLQSAIGLVVLSIAFILVSRFLPFTRGLDWAALISVGLIWGTLAVSRSPSACLGVLSQTRAQGPLSSSTLAHIMASDVLVVVLMACVLVGVRPLISAGSSLSAADLRSLGHEIVGSIAVGTTLGLALAGYLRLVGGNLLLLLLALGFGLSEFMRYIQIDPLLSFMTAGFVVQNLSLQGDALLHSVEQTSSLVFTVFFAIAGAHLDLPLLGQLWPIALCLCGARAIVAFLVARWSTRLAGDPPLLRRWSWAPLISQAGLTLGLSVVIVRTFPEFGEGFRSLIIASVALNEMVGPILFKLALDRTGETAAGARGGAAPGGHTIS